MLEQILDSLKVVGLPTKTNFRGISSREVALFEGPSGWAEFSPFLEYDSIESVPWLTSAVEAAFGPRPVRFREYVEVNATLPDLNDPAEIEKILDSFPGCTVIKIKVGNHGTEDKERIEVVRSLRPDARIRIDVNGLWNIDQAEQFLNLVGEIEYVEQPCATIDELRELKKRTNVKIVGDEILRKAINPFELDLDGAIDILMLKVAPLGGITRALRIAEKYEMPVVVSSALESAVGISNGLALAASMKKLDFASGLGTGSLLSSDVALNPIIDGKMSVSPVSPDPERLRTHQVSSERLEWWKNRIVQTWSSGAKQYLDQEGWGQ